MLISTVPLDHVSKISANRRVLDDVTFAVPKLRAFCLLGRSDDVEMLAAASARVTSDAAQIAEGIRKGEGTNGKVLKDDELYQRVTTIAQLPIRAVL